MKNIFKKFAVFAALVLAFASHASTNAFYFAQITDTHFGKSIHNFRFTNAVDRINNLPFPIEMVAHTGDFASDNLERNAETISNLLSKITIAPLIVVPGNHDLTSYRPPTRLGESLTAYLEHIGELGTIRETENAFYVGVCTEGLFRDLTSVTDFDPIVFVRDALASNTNSKPAFVFTHRPDGDDFYNNTLQPSRMERRDEWRQTLADGKATAIIAGHFHREEYHDDSYGVPTYVAGSIADSWGRQGSFRVYYYKDGKLSYFTVYIEDPAEEKE
jgi:predicted phosphodiesterase